MASIAGVMQHLGMDHQPFPQSGPAQPGHDGVVPSETNHRDIDDENEEGTEDKEGDSKRSNE